MNTSDILHKPHHVKIKGFSHNDPNVVSNLLCNNDKITKLSIENIEHIDNDPTWLLPTLQALKFTNIKKLVLWHATMSDEHFKALIAYIQNTNKLEYLKIKRTLISENLIVDLANAIHINTSIKHLSLSGCRKDNEELNYPYGPKLLELLQNKKFETLCLDHFTIDDDNAKFVKNMDIKKLKLIFCIINYNPMGDVVKYNTHMDLLSVVESDFVEGNAQDMFSSIEKHSFIKTFIFNRNENDTDIYMYEQICKVIMNNKVIENYDFYCAMNTRCYIQITKGLQYNTVAKKLNMNMNYHTNDYDENGNEIKDGSCNERFENLMKYTCPIEELNLNTNSITSRDVRFIAEKLKNNKVLKILKMSNNSFTLDDMEVLFTALKYNNTLEKLNLKNCDLCDECVEVISEMLINNTVLKVLNLKDNNITKIDENLKFVVL